MLSYIIERLDVFHRACPLLFYATSVVFALFVVFFCLVEYFKPVGKRRGQRGIKPRLPPGPSGIPLLGSLLTLKNLREDHDRQHVSMKVQHRVQVTLTFQS